LACGLDITDSQQRQDLVHTITKNGWHDDEAMWHVTDQSASTVMAAQTFIKQNLIGKLVCGGCSFGPFSLVSKGRTNKMPL